MKQTDTKDSEGETNVAPAPAVENASVKRPRAHYIDLVRGICALSIVFIHTCFHSGGSYVPMPMRSISLLLDVPAFFFIAGMTRAYIQKDTILSQLFKLSMIFVLLGFLCNLIDGGVTWTSIFRPMFLMGINVSSLFKSVSGSYWFVPVYASTIILGGVIIKHTGGGYIMGGSSSTWVTHLYHNMGYTSARNLYHNSVTSSSVFIDFSKLVNLCFLLPLCLYDSLLCSLFLFGGKGLFLFIDHP